MRRMQEKARVQVVLHAECIRYGGRKEYPHRWVGTFVEKPACVSDRMVYVIFSHPYDVTVTRKIEGKWKQVGVRRTDDQNGMLIPFWLIKELPQNHDFL